MNTRSGLSHLTVNGFRGARRGRGSRSPSPTPNTEQAFFQPPPEVFVDAQATMPVIPDDASPDELRRIAEQASEANLQLQRNQDKITAALESATQAAAAATAALNALRLNTPGVSAPAPRRKKPDLPSLDTKNIEIWISKRRFSKFGAIDQ